MDHAVKIWTLCTPVIKHTIESSFISRSSSSRSLQSQPLQQQQKTCCSSHGIASMPVFVHLNLIIVIFGFFVSEFRQTIECLQRGIKSDKFIYGICTIFRTILTTTSKRKSQKVQERKRKRL